MPCDSRIIDINKFSFKQYRYKRQALIGSRPQNTFSLSNGRSWIILHSLIFLSQISQFNSITSRFVISHSHYPILSVLLIWLWDYYYFFLNRSIFVCLTLIRFFYMPIELIDFDNEWKWIHTKYMIHWWFSVTISHLVWLVYPHLFSLVISSGIFNFKFPLCNKQPAL